MELNSWAIAGMVVVGALTFYLGYYGSRTANTTPDFLVARRVVRSRRNATAIAGEYLSAASFLGIAGLILKDGVDALWYSIGGAAGYLALLLFVAAPLRRSGAYTLPDFAEARLQSVGLRKLSSVVVVLIAFLYLTPQLQGAGLTLSNVLPVPAWTGEAVVLVAVVANVLGGGMRAVTLVQAFQYWVKLFAIAAPAFVLCTVYLMGTHPSGPALSAPTPPAFLADTTVNVQTPVRLRVDEPVQLRGRGMVGGFVTDGVIRWDTGEHTVDGGTKLEFSKGSPVPVVVGAPTTNASWLRPVSSGPSGLFTDYSLMFALFAGAMGLPHVLVRFYTNPDGRAARRSTLYVLLLLGVFYLFPTILGGLSRLYVPELLVTGKTDVAVLLLPSKVIGGQIGQLFTAVVAAGAFAAFLSTSSGLVASIAGVLSTDVFTRGRVRDFRLAAAISGLIPLGLALFLHPQDISVGVGIAFTLAASTFCPLLVLGIWWRRLTSVGAAAGIVVGGGLVIAALVLNIVSGYTGNWAPPILLQPALVTVPIAFGVVILVSRATRYRVPADVNGIMMRLHAPDPLGFTRDRDIARFGTAEERARLMHGRHRKST